MHFMFKFYSKKYIWYICIRYARRGYAQNKTVIGRKQMEHNRSFLLNSKFLLQNELQKRIPMVGIYKKGKKNKKNAKKRKKKTTGTPTANDLKGPTITRPKTLPF